MYLPDTGAKECQHVCCATVCMHIKFCSDQESDWVSRFEETLSLGAVDTSDCYEKVLLRAMHPHMQALGIPIKKIE